MRIRYFLLSLITVFGAAAQERITVPVSNPSQPVTIKVSMPAGSIKVTAGSGHDLIVSTEESSRGSRGRPAAAPPGMKRIGGGPGLNIEEDHNVVTISAGVNGAGAGLVIEAPFNTNLQLKTTNPSIDVTGVNGDIEVENTNGSIRLTNVSGSVVAHTVNGSVTASIGSPGAGKPMSFTSLNGKVDVTLPADTKARLRLKTDNGSIFSDFDLKLETGASAASANSSQRISLNHSVTGSINGGGPEYSFQTMNGNIVVRKGGASPGIVVSH